MANIPHQWLRKRGTRAEFERAHLERTAALFNLPFEKVAKKFGDRPFGERNDGWVRFVQQLAEGDELWFFSSPADTFVRKCGCVGYAIVRDGIVRDTLITLMT